MTHARTGGHEIRPAGEPREDAFELGLQLLRREAQHLDVAGICDLLELAAGFARMDADQSSAPFNACVFRCQAPREFV